MAAVDGAIFEMLNEGVALASVADIFCEELDVRLSSHDELEIGHELSRSNSTASLCNSGHYGAANCTGLQFQSLNAAVAPENLSLKDLGAALECGLDAPQGEILPVQVKDESAQNHPMYAVGASLSTVSKPSSESIPALVPSPSASSDDQDEESQVKPSPKKKAGKKPNFWSKLEHEKFMDGLRKFGGHSESDLDPHLGLGPGVAELISMVVGTRTVSQVRSHAQKYFIRLAKQIRARTSFSYRGY